MSESSVKPPPDRLYGRARGHALRPRQERLMRETLPRLRLSEAQAADPGGAFAASGGAFAAPAGAFARAPEELWLEVGFGGGEHALAQAGAHPQAGLIACEVFENGICSLLTRLVPDGEEATGALPPNLRIWPDDARALLRLLPDASVARLFLLFPDPWPKSRHAKRRFVHPALLPLVARVLSPGAEWRIASDDPTYQDWVRGVLAGQDRFTGTEPVAERPAGWPPTRYEAKALRAGRQPLYWSLRRA